MDVENGIIYTPYFNEFTRGDIVERKFLCVKDFYYKSVIWYDGFKLAFGSTSCDRVEQLIEVGTGALCATSDEVRGKKNIEKLLYEKFLQKLSGTGKSLGELVRAFNERETCNVKTWQIGLLIT